ncbi:MAG: T9SS type A sorting domain-containing protein, partial [Tannerella sp.]|nr:T9SS type A sorting domain-containing protein [Tannerella sp.]
GERDYYANYRYSGRDVVAVETVETDRIWSAGDEAFIRTSRTGSIVRIYTTDGVMHEQHTILSAGTTKIRLEPGVYIVTLNNGTGQKILIR